MVRVGIYAYVNHGMRARLSVQERSMPTSALQSTYRSVSRCARKAVNARAQHARQRFAKHMQVDQGM